MGFVCFSRIASTRSNGDGEAKPWRGRHIRRRKLVNRIIPNGQQIAVKKLIQIGFSNDKGFFKIQSLGNIRHENTVSLIEVCWEAREVSFGNNGDHLDWDSTHKSAVEAAEGLCYLHHDFTNQIITAT